MIDGETAQRDAELVGDIEDALIAPRTPEEFARVVDLIRDLAALHGVDWGDVERARVTRGQRMDFKAIEWVETPRGWMAMVEAPAEMDRDNPEVIGEDVTINGEAFRCIGVERNLPNRPIGVGEVIGLLIEVPDGFTLEFVTDQAPQQDQQ